MQDRGGGHGGVGSVGPPTEDPQDTFKTNVAKAYVKSSLMEYLQLASWLPGR
jgi:hypothetical protein